MRRHPRHCDPDAYLSRFGKDSRATLGPQAPTVETPRQEPEVLSAQATLGWITFLLSAGIIVEAIAYICHYAHS
jgi:hypothetical protein